MNWLDRRENGTVPLVPSMVDYLDSVDEGARA